MESGVGADVEPSEESGLRLRLLGPFALLRGEAPLALPPSRKVRALIAWLALTPQGASRSRLCELLWDAPNDPRGELRWCLSKARALLDAPGRPRLLAEGEQLRLDLAGLGVDALEVQHAVQAGLATLAPVRLQALAMRFDGGDFLEGLEIDRSPAWTTWLVGQRRHFRSVRLALLERLARALPPGSDAAIAALEHWLQQAPHDRRAHAELLQALARRGRWSEGEAHLAATARLFEAEGQDWAPIGHAWRAARLAQAGPGGVLPAAPRSAESSATAESAVPPAPRRRASLAVMPFAEPGRAPGAGGGLADGLVHDVITRLAMLRSLFVIAQGTVFALDARSVAAGEAARRLDVDYVASGMLQRSGERLRVSVQLAETRSARVLWAEAFEARLGQPFEVLEAIGNRIVAALAGQIEAEERQRAVLKPPDVLDAWGAHHRGLWHMVRFDRADNAQARRHFEQAIRLDPGFARPYAGLSFTHFQDAFLGWGERAPAVEAAYRSAAHGLMADALDPAAHWALGRAEWLRGRVEASLDELDTAVALSPNFALGHYTLAFVHAQTGDPQAAIRASDLSRALSPFDPLLFAMLCTRAMALMRLGRHDEAADWAVKAAARPNAHVHIAAIAAHCLALAGRMDEAEAQVHALHRQLPAYRVDDLLTAFRFAEDAEGMLRRIAPRIALA